MSALRRQEKWYAAAFLAPFMLTVAVFFLYALGRAIWFSLTDYNLFDAPNFVGFANYVALFSDGLFLNALWNSVSYALVVTIIQTTLALMVAAALNQKIRGLGFFRTVYYLPSILSSAAITLVFLWFYQRTGMLNQGIAWVIGHGEILLAFLGTAVLVQIIQVWFERRRQFPVGWLDPALALVSVLAAAVITAVLYLFGVVEATAHSVEFIWLNTRERWLGVPIPIWAIVIQNVFTTVPSLMLLYLAALQGVPRSLYEAATLDGATPVQQFLYITVPMLRPVTFLVVTLSLISTLQVFDQVALFGSAAPLDAKVTLAYYAYNSAFPHGQTPRVGMGSAGALFLAVLTLGIVWLQRRFGIGDRGV